MAITRTTWVDDDGTGTTGTIINNAELQKIYNNIDAMPMPYQFIAATDTGTIAKWTPPGFGTRNALIYWQGTVDATMNGLTAGVTGQSVVIKNRGNGILRFPHGAVADAFFNLVTSGPTALALNGWCQFIFDGYVWVLCGHEQGAYIRPPFNAAVYGATTGTWTVEPADEMDLGYRLNGTTLQFCAYINASSVSDSPFALSVLLPEGYLASRRCIQPFVHAPTGANEHGFLYTEANSHVMSLQRISGTFLPSTNTTYAYWNAAIPIL
jgi:hypothetical protein